MAGGGRGVQGGNEDNYYAMISPFTLPTTQQPKPTTTTGFTATDKAGPVDTASPRPVNTTQAQKTVNYEDLANKIDAAKATGWKGTLVKIQLFFGADPEALKASKTFGSAAEKILTARQAKAEAFAILQSNVKSPSYAKAKTEEDVADIREQFKANIEQAKTQGKEKVALARAEKRDVVMNAIDVAMQEQVGFPAEGTKEREQLNAKYAEVQNNYGKMKEFRSDLTKTHGPDEGCDKEQEYSDLKSAIQRTSDSMKELLALLPENGRQSVTTACSQNSGILINQDFRRMLPQQQ